MLALTPQQLRRTLKKRQIAGNLYRADDGKFTAGSGGDSAAPAAESEPAPKAPPKRAQNAAARRERSAAEAETRATEDAAEQATRDGEDAKLDGAKTPKERQALRREIARARRERAAARRTARAERQAAERAARGQEDADATSEAGKPKKDPKAEKPKKGGGGGGGPKGEKVETPEQAAKRADVEKRRAEADKRRAAMDARRERQDAQREQDRAKREERNQRELADLATRAQTPGMKLTTNELERLVVEGLAERQGTQVSLTAAGRAQARRKPVTKAAPLLVFKDARGVDRWVAISSTAYRDRDGEIVSCKALSQAVARGDTAGERGPLRFWHVPGVELGDCDFQAVAQDGRVLIESGTFRRSEFAEALKGQDYQMSIGFVHPVEQPDAEGVYHDIAIFERSIVPPGRAANPFTSITTKERRMLTAEKDELLAQLLGGRESDAYKAATAQATKADEEGRSAGVAFKDAPEWAQVIINRIEALEATTKAVAEKAPMDPAEMVEAGATELEDGEAEEAEGESDNLLSPGEIQAIADAVAATLMGAIDGLSAKMAEVDNELKGRGYQRMKEFPAELEKLSATLATIDATVKELAGVAPARGYQGSRDNADLPAEIAAMLKGDGNSSDPYADVMKFLRPA